MWLLYPGRLGLYKNKRFCRLIVSKIIVFPDRLHFSNQNFAISKKKSPYRLERSSINYFSSFISQSSIIRCFQRVFFVQNMHEMDCPKQPQNFATIAINSFKAALKITGFADGFENNPQLLPIQVKLIYKETVFKATRLLLILKSLGIEGG